MGTLARFMLVGALLAVPGPAHAAARWVGAPELERLRLALAVSRGQTSLWLSAEVHGGGQPGALVIPVVPGTTVDPVSDAWFVSLDDATAPRVLPPLGQTAPTCGTSGPALHDTREAAGEDSLAPVEVATCESLAEVAAYGSERGVELSSDDLAVLGAAGARARFVVLTYRVPSRSVFTQTVRVRLPLVDPTLWLELAQYRRAAPLPMMLYGIGMGRMTVDHLAVLDTADVGATFHAAVAGSDYVARARSLLEGERGAAALLECSGMAPLYRWSVLPQDAGSIEPLVQTYLDRAASLGDTPLDPAQCRSAVWSARDNGAPISEICAPGHLVTGQPCAEEPSAGETDARRLLCGGADEVAYALSGSRPSQTAVTRYRLLLTAETPARIGVGFSAAPEVSAIVCASRLDVVGCVVSGPGGGGRPVPGTTPSQPVLTDDTGVDTTVDDSGTTTTVSAEGDCSGSTEPPPDGGSSPDDGCSGDSSSSSDGDTCGGDSSSSSDGDTCGGDSSSSSDGDTCGGDSSSSDGATCSGDSAGSADGATCSGSSAPSGGDCRVARSPLRRTRLSVLVLLAAALALPLRRRRYRRCSSHARVST